MSPGLLAIALQLVLLHRADGGEVLINPRQVVSLQTAAPGRPNKVVTPEALCVVGLLNGKMAAVVEPCAIVRKLLEDAGR